MIYHGIIAPGHDREVVYGINYTYKRLIFNLMGTAQIPDSQRFDTKMKIHTSTHNSDVSLAQEFQKHLSNASCKHSIVDD